MSIERLVRTAVRASGRSGAPRRRLRSRAVSVVAVLAVSLGLVTGCAGVQTYQIPQEPVFLPDALEQVVRRWSEVVTETNEMLAGLPKSADPSADIGNWRDAMVRDGFTMPAAPMDKDAVQRWIHEGEARVQPSRNRVIEIGKVNEAIRARNRAVDAEYDGVRFYRPSPYLLVYSDGADGLVWEIHLLPDPTQKMSSEPYDFLATLKYTLEFDEKGVLQKAHEESDSTAVPQALLSVVEKLAPSVLSAVMSQLRAAKDSYTLPPPHLYKLVQGDQGLEFRGGPVPLDGIKITLLPELPKAKVE